MGTQPVIVKAQPDSRFILAFPVDQATIERPADSDSLVFTFSDGMEIALGGENASQGASLADVGITFGTGTQADKVTTDMDITANDPNVWEYKGNRLRMDTTTPSLRARALTRA
jgi:hypothetical protein